VKKAGAAPKAGETAEASFGFAPETFIEVKRTAKIALEGVKVATGLPPDDAKYFPMRKTAFYKEGDPPPVPGATATKPTKPATTGPAKAPATSATPK
jgi:hypothetical protein